MTTREAASPDRGPFYQAGIPGYAVRSIHFLEPQPREPRAGDVATVAWLILREVDAEAAESSGLTRLTDKEVVLLASERRVERGGTTEAISVSFPQVVFIPTGKGPSPQPVPVWKAGLRADLEPAGDGWRLRGYAVDLRNHFDAKERERIPDLISLAERIGSDSGASFLGEIVGFDPARITINSVKSFFYAGERVEDAATSQKVAVRVVFERNAGDTARSLSYSAFVGIDVIADKKTPRLLSLVPLVAEIGGTVFAGDPISKAGAQQWENRPSATSAELAKSASLEPLTDLQLPGAKQKLIGTFVEIEQPSLLGIAIGPTVLPSSEPPEQSPGVDFAFAPRTNDFAATSAYFHMTRSFALLQRFGFDVDAFFGGTTGNPVLPIKVAHRAPLPIGPGSDGWVVGAMVEWTEIGAQLVLKRFRFALADLSSRGHPLGIAADPRIVWHEFGHALLLAGTGAPEFDFAHSIGDTLAALQSDPDSKLATTAMRGVTFPWVQGPQRRHDRRVVDGWSWTGGFYVAGERGGRDPAAYIGEELLSSTLFVLYRAIGGDAETGTAVPDLAERRRAADYVTYLTAAMLRTPYAMVPMREPGIAALALMAADAAKTQPIGTVPERAGGTLQKAIHWAFERLGLVAAAAYPAIGWPREVDVYIDDGRLGGYDYQPFAPVADTEIKVRRTFWCQFFGCRRYRVSVRVKNRGAQAANGVAVTLYVSTSTTPRWEADFKAPKGWEVGTLTEASIPGGGEAWIGKFKVELPAAGTYLLLARVETARDPSLLDPASTLPCADPNAATPLADLVPLDNNLAIAFVAT